MGNFGSFKELLLRKTDDESLRTLINFAADEVLADHVIESLQKMALHRSAGSHANVAVRDFGTEMDPELEPNMIREALGHHASRYKAALESGNQKLANDHAAQFFKIMDVAHKAQPHSQGKLSVESVDVKPWERTHSSRSETFAQRMARDPEYAKDNPVTRGKKLPHQFVNDTVGFGFQPKGNDWSFLQSDPHEAYASETSKHGHVGAYPMEHTKINGKYIPIEDVADLGDTKKPHSFDQHPILSHYGESVKTRTPEREKQYLSERDAYMSSPHVGSHLEHHEALVESGQHEHRGLQPGKPVHAGSKRAAMPESAPKAEGTKPTSPATAPAEAAKTVVRRPAPVDDKEKMKSALPAHLHDLIGKD